MDTLLNDCKKALKKTANIHNVNDRLEAINKALSAYGIEDIRGGKHWHHYYCDICALYVNMGDTYIPTIVYDAIKGKFIVCSWGDFVEKHQTKYQIF